MVPTPTVPRTDSTGAPRARLAPPPPPPTDEALAAQARAGSAEAFEELVRRYQVPLLRFLHRRGPQQAEDALQETFLRAYRYLGSYRDGRPFKPWLFTIAHRLSIDAARRSARPVPEPESEVGENPADRAARAEAAERLWADVRRALGDAAYTAVWLHYAESLPPRQVAAVMGRSWVWWADDAAPRPPPAGRGDRIAERGPPCVRSIRTIRLNGSATPPRPWSPRSRRPSTRGSCAGSAARPHRPRPLATLGGRRPCVCWAWRPSPRWWCWPSGSPRRWHDEPRSPSQLCRPCRPCRRGQTRLPR